MRTNIDIDDELVADAQKLTGLKTKKDVVDFALRELVRRRQKKNLLELAGEIEFFEGFDPKALRADRDFSD
ncbi:MAG: type II toxin-antitoxin system VapB family antitoxin [Hyphomicrobiales bacterium]|nr:type II toxin-antitoxin system VapB family antitoxin [Hyphomicrobiales bacterium]